MEHTTPFGHSFDQLANFESRDGLRTPVLLLEAEYNRARACWAACDGVPLDEVENLANIGGLNALTVEAGQAYAEADALKAQRDELLAALERMCELYAPTTVARALIAKHKGAEHPECCGCPVVGATYMGDQEQVCCGQPEPALLNDKQIAATLRAKFPALPALKTQGWMPIETAPKDGSYFLAFNGHWRGVARYFEPNYEGDPVWTDEMTKYITPPPTHWMPLPAAPCLDDAAIAKATGAARATEGSV